MHEVNHESRSGRNPSPPKMPRLHLKCNSDGVWLILCFRRGAARSFSPCFQLRGPA